MPPLSKRDAEALLAAVDAPPEQLRDALTVVLAKVLGRDGSYDELVTAAAADAGWPDARRDELLAAEQEPMWDLAAELNELRGLRTLPGKQQREVVSAIERAISALKRDDLAAVRTAAATIAHLDAAHVYPDVPPALLALADVHKRAAGVTELFTQLREALGPGPLAAELDELL